MKNRDDIYAIPLDSIGRFEFNEEVVRVFPDMIARSVPGYLSILAMLGEIGETHAQPNTNIYDLGCSLGGATLAIANRVPDSCRIVAVDSSQPMIERLDQILEKRNHDRPIIETRADDIREIEYSNCSLTILNFTLQFLPVPDRARLLGQIASATADNGAIVLSEKICFVDPVQNELIADLHYEFKRANGYSELEIAQKRSALENELIPETIENHIERLRSAGFSRATCWFQCFNFASFLAIK